MRDDILAQVAADLIASPAKFSLQLNKTTDISNLSQLVLMHCVKGDMIKEDLIYKPLTTTKADDMKKLVDEVFRDNSLS